MLRVGRPAGLIAFDTDAAVTAREAKQAPVYKLARGRTVYYAASLAAVSGLMLWGLTHRSLIDLHVLRDRNPTFVTLHDGAIRNGYTLKIANRTFEPRPMEIRFAGPAGVQLKTPGEPTATQVLKVDIPPNEVRAVRVFVTAPRSSVKAANMPARFDVRAGEARTQVATTFLSGAANP